MASPNSDHECPNNWLQQDLYSRVKSPKLQDYGHCGEKRLKRTWSGINPGPRNDRVALCGYYGYGNFGDDLMAILLGLSIRERGIDFTIYRLCNEEAIPFGFKNTDSIDDLLSGARYLIWGGGGLLVSWPSFLYSILYPRVAGRYSRLIKAAANLGLKFWALSVGGSGDDASRLTPGFKQAFLNAAEYVSVRNPQDVLPLNNKGVQCEYFPDVIWQTADRFPVKPRSRGSSRIGVDLYFSNLARRRALHLVPLLLKITRMRPDCEFIFLDSTNKRVRPNRSLGRIIRGPNVRSYQFSDLTADVDFLASLDLLISSRLHTPMICMGYGVPALSIFGEKKSILMMNNLDLSGYCLGRPQMAWFSSLLTHKDRLTAFLERYRFPDTSRLRSQSYGHQRQLDRILS